MPHCTARSRRLLDDYQVCSNPTALHSDLPGDKVPVLGRCGFSRERPATGCVTRCVKGGTHPARCHAVTVRVSAHERHNAAYHKLKAEAPGRRLPTWCIHEAGLSPLAIDFNSTKIRWHNMRATVDTEAGATPKQLAFLPWLKLKTPYRI